MLFKVRLTCGILICRLTKDGDQALTSSSTIPEFPCSGRNKKILIFEQSDKPAENACCWCVCCCCWGSWSREISTNKPVSQQPVLTGILFTNKYKLVFQQPVLNLIGIFIYNCNLCLSVCLSDHNSWNPGPIGLEFWLGNSGEPRERA